jgi:hypothetical protein
VTHQISEPAPVRQIALGEIAGAMDQSGHGCASCRNPSRSACV